MIPDSPGRYVVRFEDSPLREVVFQVDLREGVPWVVAEEGAPHPVGYGSVELFTKVLRSAGPGVWAGRIELGIVPVKT